MSQGTTQTHTLDSISGTHIAASTTHNQIVLKRDAILILDLISTFLCCHLNLHVPLSSTLPHTLPSVWKL